MADGPGALIAAPVAGAPRCELGESPRWHEGRWWWVDAAAGVLYAGRPGPDGWQVTTWLSTDGRLSMVHPAGGGRVVVARGPTLQFYDSQVPGRAGPVFATVEVPAGWLLNDGAADADGGVWIGIVHPERVPESGRLQRFSRVGCPVETVAGVTLSNGIAFDPAATVMYHADSLARTVTAHRLHPDGAVHSSAVFIHFEADDGMPDGIATDLDGGVWVAVYGAGQVRRYDRNGQLDTVVAVPTAQVTSVALGGPDGRDLLITTAREGFDDERSAAEPLAGRVFWARSAHAGRPVFQVRPPGRDGA